MDAREILDDVRIAIDIAMEHGLEVEVMAYAMMALKQKPTLTIDEALKIGLNEWVK